MILSGSNLLRKLGLTVLATAVLCSVVLFGTPPSKANAADAFDTLRGKWLTYLTGGTAAGNSDADIAAAVSGITDKANVWWSSMDKSPGRTYLWSDLATWSSSSTITSTYTRLKEMALAYATAGSQLQGNTALAADIVSGLDWMYAVKYNESKGESGNWWDWEIGAPLLMTDVMVLMYDNLSATQKVNYIKALDKFVPDPTYRTNSTSLKETGANRLDKSLIVALRGVLGKSSNKLDQARDAISQVLPYVQDGDGFYEDGSFIQHNYIAYTGSYGAVLLDDIAKLLYLLGDSAWNLTDPGKANIIRWVQEAYRPFFYQGAMMDTVRGRAVSRETATDHAAGRNMLASMVQLADGMNAGDAASTRSIAKGQIMADHSFENYYSGLTVYKISRIKNLIANTSISPAVPLVTSHVFAGMDRALQLRPSFGLALGMFSTRISPYEAGNSENIKGWWQGAGTAFLYNGDQKQYSADYWSTVNPVRLPGITTDGSTASSGSFAYKFNTSNWVGGSDADGNAASVGMQFSMSNITSSNLSGKKSWFMFGDKYIALGADIKATGGRNVETIVENRKLKDDGSNVLTVNGTVKSVQNGWSETMKNVKWAHLSGNAAGSDIAYVFPDSATVNGLRETRTGAWKDINPDGSTAIKSRRYLSLAVPHGIDPVQSAYNYAVLPGASANAAATYAASPGYTVLANSSSVQAVRDNDLHIVGANFWTSSPVTVKADGADYLTSNQKASVTLAEADGIVSIGIADPTQANTGSIRIELHKPTQSVVQADAGITVVQTSPTTVLQVNTSGSLGATFHARLRLAPATNSVAVAPSADAYVRDGSNAGVNYGSEPSLVVKQDEGGYVRRSLLSFQLASVTGSVYSAKIKLVPTYRGNDGNITQQAKLISDDWSESVITWDNQPTAGPIIGTWTVPEVGTGVYLDVTTAVQNAIGSGQPLSIQLSGVTSGQKADVIYGSKEHTNTAYRPVLICTMQ